MRFFAFLLMLLTLAACGAAPAAQPPAVPAAAPSTPIAAVAQALADELLPRLASQLGVEPGSLSLTNAEAVSWRNSALGCPAPDAMYTQVIIDGYVLTFSDGIRSYSLHTSGPEGPALICDNGSPQPLGP